MTTKKIKIATDSVSDLSNDILAQYDIAMVPCSVNYNNRSYTDDGVDLDRTAYYEALPDMPKVPTTAAPPPALAEQLLRDGFDGYDHLVSINVPARYSATLNNVALGAHALPDGTATILDSGQLSMGMGLQALIAVEAAKTGDVQYVIDTIHAVQEHVRLYAAIASLEYLRRSGRVNTLVARIGTLLQIKPVVHVEDGEIGLLHRIRTFSKAVDKVEALIRAQAPLAKLIMLHIQNKQGAEALLARMADIAPPDTPIVEVGPTLGTHIGPGSVGAVTLPIGWDKNLKPPQT